MAIISKSCELGGRLLTLETGRLAPQATGAVLACYGETMVLATVVRGEENPNLGYFPLTVDYLERLYAGGRIKGSRWVKREGRPSDEAILTSRLVDRSIRPLFPKNYFQEVQVIITVLSVDSENDPDVLAIIATSAALSVSDIPWQGPVGALRVGFRDGAYFPNPQNGELEFSDMDLVVSATQETIVMIEADAHQVLEKTMIGAFNYAQEEIKKIIALIEELQEEVGQEKLSLPQKEEKTLEAKIQKIAQEKIQKLMSEAQKKPSENKLDELKEEISQKFAETEKALVFELVDELAEKILRQMILEKKQRPDGRSPEEIRPIETEVGLLPRTHGSAMFKRGETQVLTVVTLGSPSLEQLIEGPTGEETKRYIHHYNMPPFSTGETGRLGWPSRREVGHGALAERALLSVIPPEEKFPYTIRVVSEVMSSNGSTSMASVCGSTLALMDAGVPIASPVAGIAMGLIKEKDRDEILSDIDGFEDFFGDMDFKVAGTEMGITVLQMDNKIGGVKGEILTKALEQARVGRLSILEKIRQALPAPRSQLSPYAPKVAILHIPVEAIGEVIGPGGKVIRNIIAQTGATVDVEDDGTITVSGMSQEGIDKAVAWIQGLTRKIEAGETFEGEVKRLLPFGAFVEILPGKEGLVHISQMTTGFVQKPEDVVQIGQKVKVRVSEIDEQGRINLSMLFGEDAQKPRLERRPRPQYRPGFSPHLGRRGLSDRFRQPAGFKRKPY